MRYITYGKCECRRPGICETLVENINANVTVFVPDGYYRATPHPEIPAQTFVTGAGNVELLSTVDGNHGFCTSGIIGARHDDKNTTGVHSDPAGRLSIRSMPIGGLTMPEIISEIVENMPTGRFVLSTSFGFAKDISEFSKAKRAIQAMDWRRQARPRKDDFIHIASAGNEGMRTDDSRYAAMGSAFNVAAAYDSPFDLYGPGEIGPLDFAVLEAYWTYTLSVSPFNAVKMDNVIVVGSSDLNGNESLFSNPGSLVRAQGEDVAAPCVRVDPADVDGGCFATTDGLHISYYDGTSFSTPQVAGLAAYLLSLDPNLTNSELYNIIYNAYISSPNPGFVDGYGATLALDKSMSSSTVRPTLLDVVDNTFNESPDGKFDEYDIQQFLAKFDQYEQLRSGIPDAPADYSRYDLNGDGFTGGTNHISRFDLDINSPPQYTGVSVTAGGDQIQFDENSVVDLDVLCYYAHTPLYNGVDSLRDQLLVDCACSQVAPRDAQCSECDVAIETLFEYNQRTAAVVAGWDAGDCPDDEVRVVLPLEAPYDFGSFVQDLSTSDCDESSFSSTQLSSIPQYDTTASRWTWTVNGNLSAEVPNDSFVAPARSVAWEAWVFKLSDSCTLHYTVHFTCNRSWESDWANGVTEWTLFNRYFQFTPDLGNTIDTTFSGTVSPSSADNLSLGYYAECHTDSYWAPGVSAFVDFTLTIVVEAAGTNSSQRARLSDASLGPERQGGNRQRR